LGAVLAVATAVAEGAADGVSVGIGVYLTLGAADEVGMAVSVPAKREPSPEQARRPAAATTPTRRKAVDVLPDLMKEVCWPRSVR
jgi:hypothetical protein